MGSDQVNSGTAIELKAVNMNYRIGLNKDNSESPNSSTTPEVNPVSFSSAKLTVNGVLDSKITADMDLMVDLRDMSQSKGVKLVFYSSTTDGFRDITDSLGDADKDDVHKNANFGSASTPHLHVVIISFQISQTRNSRLLSYTLVMEETT